MTILRTIHRWRAPIAAIVLGVALLMAERLYTLIVELCLWAAVLAVAYELDSAIGRAAAVLGKRWAAGRRGAATDLRRTLMMDALRAHTTRAAGLHATIATDVFTSGSFHQC
jgi:hypothetical protein